MCCVRRDEEIPCVDKSVDMRTELKLQMAQTANNQLICDALRPNPLPTRPPESGALVLGLLGMALSLSGVEKWPRFSGTCPHCGAPVDAEERKCAYCDCYYD